MPGVSTQASTLGRSSIATTKTLDLLSLASIVSNDMAPSKLKKQPALPLRCAYLDTDDLMTRLLAIYKSEKNFQLEVFNSMSTLGALWPDSDADVKRQTDSLRGQKADEGLYSNIETATCSTGSLLLTWLNLGRAPLIERGPERVSSLHGSWK